MTDEQYTGLLDALQDVSSKLVTVEIVNKDIYKRLELQEDYYKQFDIPTYEEYQAQLIAQKEADEANAVEIAKTDEAAKKISQDRHDEIVTNLEKIEASSSGDITTTLSSDFKSFTESYTQQTTDFNIMLWVVFVTFLLIVGIRSFTNQIKVGS